MPDDIATPSRGLIIGHPTTLSDEEHAAFVHAVALARESRSTLVSIHANDEARALERMPRGVDLLVRWNALPISANEGDEQQLGMRHERVVDDCCDDPVDTLVRAMRARAPQLLVGATSGREGLARVMVSSVAEALALHVHAPALLLPTACRGFVSERDGSVRLRRLLVAAGDPAAARVGAQRAVWLADVAGASDVEIELLHVADGSPMPEVTLPMRQGARFHAQTVQGSLEPALLARADAMQADIIVMPTRGHDSLRDVLLGSHAERVLRRAPCPVLSVPIH